MGWIYNGSEFIKANKSQREAYTKYQRELTIRGALAQPAALPTIAVLGLTLAGVPLGIKLFKTAEETLEDAKKTVEKIVEEKVIDPAKPAAAVAADIADCISSARVSFPWGKLWVPGVSESKFISCIMAKGFSKTEAAEFLRQATTTAGFFL